MTSRREYLKGLMAAGSVSSLGLVSRESAAAENTFSSAVSREGAQLSIDGEAFYFNGANAPWLTHTYPSKSSVDNVLAFANDLGIDVLRTGIHSVNVGGAVHSPSPGQLGEEAFSHVDYVLQEAEKYGIRLVFSLADNWDYYGGMDAYVNSSATASEHDDFYTDAQCRTWYKQYVEKVLTRENTLTGRVYKDDPTILMWELANEAEAKSAGVAPLQGWYEEMAAYVKSIDSTHLLSTGSGGNYNTDSDLWLYSGKHGVDYIQNHQIPEIDVCSFHLYPEWSHSDTNEFGQKWIREHFEDAHNTIGKPAFLGEFGWAKGRTPDRPTVYADWFDVVDQTNGAGAAAWQLIEEGRSETGKHDIRPSDTGTADVLAQFASVQRAKGWQSGGGGDGGSDDGTAETSSLAGERLLVEGGGADVWGTADEFHFASEQVSGDATLVAKIAAQENTDPWAKAGLMIRDGFDPGASHATMALTPESGAAFQYRPDPDSGTNHAGASGGAPHWVKIERVGDAITGYVSPDGESWTEAGRATLPMESPHIGLAVTSHSSGTLSTTRFERISGSADSLLSSWSNRDVGSVNVAGSVSTVDDSVAVTTGDPTDVTETAATLHGSVPDLGGASAVDVSFEYGPAGGDQSSTTAVQTRSSTGAFSTTIDGLDASTEYTFRAVGSASDGETDSGATVSFMTGGSADDGTNVGPTIDAYVVTEAGSPNPHAEITADWSVADADEDVSTVVVEVFDANGSRLDSSSTSVSGGSASGSDSFQIKHGDNASYDVTLTVTDAGGADASRTESTTS